MRSDIDSINLNAKKCVNLTSATKSVNLTTEVGKISSISYDNSITRSTHGTILVKSDRDTLNVESYKDMEVLAEQGDITIEAPNGEINIEASHNINITPGPDNQVYVAGNFRATKISQGSANSESGLLVPTGTIVPYCGLTSPVGWFICDGSTYDTIVYRDLFLVIGTRFGGSGSNFAVPDMRGRAIVGSSSGISGISNKSVGDIGGAETHTLTIDEIPSHTHSTTAGSGTARVQHSALVDYSDVPTNDSASTGSIGGGQAHSIMQPYITLNYIIKY